MTHCGHPESGFVTSGEGTAYCPVCERLSPDRIAELEAMEVLLQKDYEIVVEALRGLASTQKNQEAAGLIVVSATAALREIIDTYEGAAQAVFVQHLQACADVLQACECFGIEERGECKRRCDGFQFSARKGDADA